MPMTKTTDHSVEEFQTKPRWPLLIFTSALVLAFRGAAWIQPSQFIEIPPAMALPLTGLGILFLACGVWAWASGPSRITWVFLLHAIGGAFHWGGTIGAQNEGLAVALLVFYLAATVMGDAAFLDLSLHYPGRIPQSRLTMKPFYGVAILTLLAVPIAPLLPKSTLEAGLGIVFLLSLIMSIAGGAAFIVQWFRASPAQRDRYALTPIIASLIISTAVDLLVDARLLPGSPEAWNLVYGLVPVTLAWALIRAARPSATHAADEGDASTSR